MFGFFNKKNKDGRDIENIVMGYLRKKNSELLGLEPGTKESNDAYQSTGAALKILLLPFLDRQIMQDVTDTFISISSDRVEELFGEYVVLLQLRFTAVSAYVLKGGGIDLQDATPNKLANVIHEEIKNLIKQVEK